MRKGIPEIPPEQDTPLVRQLLEIIYQQQEEIAQLRLEIAILKNQTKRPKLAPSRLENETKKETRKERKRRQKPGQERPRPKPKDVRVQVPDPPPGSKSLGYEPFTVQDLVIQCAATRYLRQRLLLPDGTTVLAPLPDDVIFGHFAAGLIRFCIYQHHHNHVTQPLLLEELQELGVAISAGQLSRILTDNKDAFDEEKAEVLVAGLQSSYIQVDDTGARHRGRNGYCLHIGNEFFAYFESTDSKSRLNFLQVLRQPHRDYVINEAAVAYWQKYQLRADIMAKLQEGPQYFADVCAWNARLQELGISGERHRRITTEGALLGSLIEHGVSPDLVVLSDGAQQFFLLVHAACWIHAERPLARMNPYSDKHREAIEKARQQIWELYKALKAYRQEPDPAQVPQLRARFDILVEQQSGFPGIDQVFKEMRAHQADLLCVLDRPQVPLHNNTSESHLRDYVKKRKISGGTRSAAGRRCRDTFASLKKTCRCLGLTFWSYLVDRLGRLGQIPRLADLIRQRIAETPATNAVAVPA